MYKAINKIKVDLYSFLFTCITHYNPYQVVIKGRKLFFKWQKQIKSKLKRLLRDKNKGVSYTWLLFIAISNLTGGLVIWSPTHFPTPLQFILVSMPACNNVLRLSKTACKVLIHRQIMHVPMIPMSAPQI